MINNVVNDTSSGFVQTCGIVNNTVGRAVNGPGLFKGVENDTSHGIDSIANKSVDINAVNAHPFTSVNGCGGKDVRIILGKCITSCLGLALLGK